MGCLDSLRPPCWVETSSVWSQALGLPSGMLMVFGGLDLQGNWGITEAEVSDDLRVHA